MSGPPRFAVVGRVNKGKSSIVATLAEDESVRIDPRPGTTTEVREYPVRVDGRTLFVLVDTPGFEDAPRALAWLRASAPSAAERPGRVADFIRTHEATGDFQEERRLLAPILGGACVLYVVDGTRPFRPNYEAEMEILRWTGRPGLALVNRLGGDAPAGGGRGPVAGGAAGSEVGVAPGSAAGSAPRVAARSAAGSAIDVRADVAPGEPPPPDASFAAEWHRALGQFFGIVRDFDALAATFEERLHLLEAFRALEPAWRATLDEAIAALVAQRRRRRAEAASEVADLVADALTHVEEVAVPDEAALAAERDRLERSFHDALRRREERARRRVEGLYGHARAVFAERELVRPVLEQDLFAEEAWRVLGLSPGQLVLAGALAGATAGGALDAAVGGASFLAGSALGGAVGGGAALYGVGRRFARVRPVGPGALPGFLLETRRLLSGGRRFRIGPHAQPNFPWVLLDRALLHYGAVVRRTHAFRGVTSLPEGARSGVVAELGAGERRELTGVFRRLRRAAPDVPRALRDALEGRVARVLARVDPLPGDDAPSDGERGHPPSGR